MCDAAAAEEATGSAAAAAAAGAAAEAPQPSPPTHAAATAAGFSSLGPAAKWQTRASTNCSRWSTGSSLGSVDSRAFGLRHAAADVCYRNTYQFPENNVAVLRLARPTLLPKHGLARRARFAHFSGGLPKRRGATAADAEDDGDDVCLYQITQWSIKHFQDRFAAIEMARGGLLPRLTPRSVTVAPMLASPALAAR